MLDALLQRALACALACAFASTLPAQDVRPVGAPTGMRIAFVDVAWGDGVIVVGPTGTAMVFDAGGNGMGTQRMLPQLRKMGVSRIKYLFASHYHGDHIGGLDEILNGMPVDEVWDRGTRNTRAGGSYTAYTRAAGSRRRTVSTGQIFDLGGGAKATVLAFDGNVLGTATRHRIDGTANYENSSSIVLKVEYGDFSCWLGGDLTGGGNRYDMETPVSRVCGDVDVYLANHHGWDDGSNQNLIDAIDPEVCVISCSHRNTHNVPHRAVLDRMSTRTENRLVVSTTPGSGEPGFTAGGTMTLVTDGWRYQISSQAGASIELYTDEYRGITPNAGDLVISEIHRFPSLYWGEFIEVYNRSGSPLNLKGLEVVSSSGSFKIHAPYRVLPRGRVLLCAHGDASRNGRLPFAHSWPARSVILHNDKDDVTIKHSWKTLERVSYDRGFPGAQRISAERRDVEQPATASNFRSATAGYGDRGDRGTPGEVNSAEAGIDIPLRVGAEVLAQNAPGGGAVHFFETTNRWRGKVVALGLSTGTTPGFKVGPTHIPLNMDSLFRLVDGMPAFIGFVPQEGLRAIRLPVPASLSLTGLPIFCACYVYDKNGPPFIPEASRALRVVLP